jgi:hypothetical protein
MAASYISAPTYLPAPPRKVHGKFSFVIWFARLFILPHVCVGVGLMGVFVLTVLTAFFGTDIEARVTKAYTTRGKNRTIYNLDYTFSAGGHNYTKSDTVSQNTYSTANRFSDIQEGTAKVKVRFFQAGPFHYHICTQDSSPGSRIGLMLFFALFWNAILSVFVYLLWISPLRDRRLLHSGEAIGGVIVSNRINPGRKSTTYKATFRFNHPITGEEIQCEITLPGREQFEAAIEGRTITVIYSPRKPRRALVYELSGYTVDGASGTNEPPVRASTVK